MIERAATWQLPVQERGGRRTFITTNSGYRVEVHPPRDWIDDLLGESDELELTELQLRTDRPEKQAGVLADLLELDLDRDDRRDRRHDRPFRPRGPGGAAGALR